MTEHEIFNQLCLHIYVQTEDSPMDNWFFKRCYEVCIKNKDEITKETIWEIVEKEYKLVKIEELEFMRTVNRL